MRPPNPFRALTRFVRFGPVSAIRNASRVRLRLEQFEGKIVPTGTWTQVALPPTLAAIGVGDMVLLNDGEVMAQGQGVSNVWFRLTADGSGAFGGGSWAPAASMSLARQRFATNVLPDGHVVVLGGEHTNLDAPPLGFTFTSTGEIYDPAANAWTALQDFPGSANLGNGFGASPSPTELLAGGVGTDGQILVGSFWGGDTWLLHPTQPAASQWTQTINNRVSASGEDSFIGLPGGNVLAYDTARSQTLNQFTAEEYIAPGNTLPGGGPSNGVWVDVSPASGTIAPLGYNSGTIHENGAPLLLPPSAAHPSGAVFWIGGDGQTAFFDLSNSTWSAGNVIGYDGTIPSPGYLAADAPAALLPNGHVLLLASHTYITAPSVLFDFNPATGLYAPLAGSSTPYPDLSNVSAIGASMLVLPNGHVLFAAGTQLWDYAPDAGTPAQTPLVAGVGNLVNGVYDGQPNADGSYNLSGTYLTGFSEGAAQGDEFNGCATNYPIVKLTLNSRVWYLNTTGWTPGVADLTLNTVKFTLPPTLAAGNFSLQVVASGIASNTITFTHNKGPVYADTHWSTGYNAGDPVANPDALAPGGFSGTFGNSTGTSGNCFASVDLAIKRAAALGVWVVVNGADPVSGFGAFHEAVAMNSQAPVYLQNRTVAFDSLVADTNDSQPSAENLVVSNATTLAIGGNDSDSPYPGAISGQGGLTKVGNGTLTLSGAGGIFGLTKVSGGVLALSASAGTTLAQSTVEMDVDFGLDVSGVSAATIGGLAGSGSIFLGFGSASLRVGGNNLDTTYSGVLTSGALVSFTKIGSGTLTLANAPNTTDRVGPAAVSGGTLTVSGALTAVGGLTVQNGTLQPLSTNALAGSTIILNAAAGLNPVLDLSQLSAVTLGGLSGNLHIELPQSTNANTLTVGSDGDNTTYSGDFYDNGNWSFVKSGPGTLVLNNLLSVNGSVTVSGGVLQAGNGGTTGAIGLSATNIVDNGVLVFDRSNLSNYSRVISGTGSVVQAGTGTVSLIAADTYSGGTTINAGALTIGSGGTAGSILGNVVDNAALVFNRSNDFPTFTGTITGSGSVTKAGVGSLTLGGINLYTGTTTVNGGRLVVVGALGNATTTVGTVTVASGATLQGTGTLYAPVVVNGTLEAGTASNIGTLTIIDTAATNALTLIGGMVVRINSATVYDQVKVTGNVSLFTPPNTIAPSLNVILNYSPDGGTPFEIIDLLNSTYHETGTFGQEVVNFDINYAGGDSNKDVVLTWIFYGGGN
jgi:autotransporter-associated beta strand protein